MNTLITATMSTLLNNPHFRLFAGAVMISFSAVFVKLVDVPPTTSGFYRALVGGGVLLAFIAITGRKIRFVRAAWIALLVSSVFFALDLWFWHRSILYIGPGLSTLLANFQVFIMAAAGIVVFGQRPSARQLLAIPLAITGLVMIVGLDWNSLASEYRLGVVLGLLTAVSYAGYLLAMRQARAYSDTRLPLSEIAVMSLLVAGILGGVAMVENVSLAIPTLRDASWLIVYGIIANGLGMMAIASSLSRVGTTEVGIALLLQPTLSFAWDILFFARPTTTIEFIGAAIALCAIYLGSRSRSK